MARQPEGERDSHTRARLPHGGRLSTGRRVRVSAPVPRSGGGQGAGERAENWAPRLVAGPRRPRQPVAGPALARPLRASLGTVLRGRTRVLPHRASYDTCKGTVAHPRPGIEGGWYDPVVDAARVEGVEGGSRWRASPGSWRAEPQGRGRALPLASRHPPPLPAPSGNFLAPRTSVSCLQHERVGPAPCQSLL